MNFRVRPTIFTLNVHHRDLFRARKIKRDAGGRVIDEDHVLATAKGKLEEAIHNGIASRDVRPVLSDAGARAAADDDGVITLTNKI